MSYNPKYYYDNTLHTIRGHKKALWVHTCSGGEIIGFFQGERGLFPDIDFQIKVLLEGEDKKIFTPAHWDWVVDLLIKSHSFPNDISAILEYYIDFYDKVCVPFNSPAERDTHILKTTDFIKSKYEHIRVERTLSIEALATLLELFCYCEKRNQPIAHQFRDALGRMRAYCLGETEMVDVLHLVCSHF